jgi:hypothetical protein
MEFSSSGGARANKPHPADFNSNVKVLRPFFTSARSGEVAASHPQILPLEVVLFKGGRSAYGMRPSPATLSSIRPATSFMPA